MFLSRMVQHTNLAFLWLLVMRCCLFLNLVCLVIQGAWNYDLELRDTLNSETSNNALLKAIEKLGWYVEPYDSETFMAYPQ